jgi:hypothetical protein
MAIFSKSSKNGVSDVEREIDQLRARRKMLAAQQETATAALARAREDRRTRLLEQDLDSIDRDKLKNIVPRLADELDAVNDALVTVDGKLADAETRLAQERDKGARKREADQRSEEVGRARMELSEYLSANARMVGALRPLASIVPAALAALENLERLGRELAVGVELALAESEAYVTQMQSGSVEIRAEAPPVTPPAPAPKVERKQVFLRHPGKWVEAGEIITAGRHVTCSPPIAIALAAIEHGHGVDPESRTAQELRGLQDPDFAFQPPASCLDISQPITPKPPEVHVTEPVVHSALPGARTGTAVALPTR